tara:strand:- start:1242 stop:2036 length:795 start_codon:yes stop_codon:yes gene_type:complete
MKKIISIISILILFLIIFYPNKTVSNGAGSPGGRTGSISDVSTCKDCHYSGNGNGGTITSNIPSSGYIPGQTYTITTTIQDTGIFKFGFEITAEDNNGNKRGNFLITNSNETKAINNMKAVTHTFSGTSGQNTKSWNFDWQAPGFASSTGSVTFYASFIAANSDNSNTGDTYHFDSISVSEEATNLIIENQDDYIKILRNKILINRDILDIDIYNINGDLILNYQNIKAKEIINLSQLTTGMYIISITDFNYKNKKIKTFIINK